MSATKPLFAIGFCATALCCWCFCTKELFVRTEVNYCASRVICCWVLSFTLSFSIVRVEAAIKKEIEIYISRVNKVLCCESGTTKNAFNFRAHSEEAGFEFSEKVKVAKLCDCNCWRQQVESFTETSHLASIKAHVRHRFLEFKSQTLFSKLPSATSISLLQGSISWQESIFVSSILTALQTAHTTRRKHFIKPEIRSRWLNTMDQLFHQSFILLRRRLTHKRVSVISTTWCKVNSDYLCFFR